MLSLRSMPPMCPALASIAVCITCLCSERVAKPRPRQQAGTTQTDLSTQAAAAASTHLVHQGVPGEGLPCLRAIARDNVDDSRGEACLHRQLCQADGGQHCLLSRLQIRQKVVN